MSVHEDHIHPEWGVEQVGWLGQTGAVYALADPPYDGREPGSFTPLYMARGEPCGHVLDDTPRQHRPRQGALVAAHASRGRWRGRASTDIGEVGVLDAATVRRAQVTVCDRAGDVDEARRLLRMLGIGGAV